MTFFANYALSRYAAIEYGVRGPASYVAFTGDSVTGGDVEAVFARFNDIMSGELTAADGAVFYFFEPIAVFALEPERRAQKLLADIREAKTDGRKPLPVHTENRTETIHAREPERVRAENRAGETDEKRSDQMGVQHRQAQTKDCNRSTSIKSDSRNFTA